MTAPETGHPPSLRVPVRCWEQPSPGCAPADSMRVPGCCVLVDAVPSTLGQQLLVGCCWRHCACACCVLHGSFASASHSPWVPRVCVIRDYRL